MVILKNKIFISITILLLFCGLNIQSIVAQTTENKQFEMVVIINGDLCRSIRLFPYKNGISEEIKQLEHKLGYIVTTDDDFNKLVSSDSIKVQCSFFSEKDKISKNLSFSIKKHFYDVNSGPLVRICTLDDNRNKHMFKGLKRKFLYYIVDQIIIGNINRSFNEIQFHEIRY